ncbi:hypothetical protein [Sphingomonas sp. dw_22]|uniref:hypothetical protein n=1 Tax=Sphingomonas sp. dw_22 TaxID=2721175 RepID=UPI001BD515F0|nr:hypothetical protein [Sphingomonas sp. dw_22]
MMDANPIDPALDAMAVAPGPESDETKPSSTPKDAGADKSILERLERNPESKEARLDRALDESMDASDPPASTQPVHNHEPPESSGYDAKAEKKLAAGNRGIVGRILSRIGLG